MLTSRRRLTIAVVIAASSLAACSAKTIQVYSGPQLPKEKISVLNVDRSASPGVSDIAIRRVNGVDTLRNDQPYIEVLPGKQVVRVDLTKNGDARDAFANAHSINTISFQTIPGRTYRIRGTIEDGIGKVWVVDDQNQKIVANSGAN